MVRASAFVCLSLLLLSACAGSEKGTGVNGLDTITAEDREQEAWFKSFYGKDHCGVSQGVCKPGDNSGSDSGTGGWWGVGGTPDGAAAGHDYGSGW